MQQVQPASLVVFPCITTIHCSDTSVRHKGMISRWKGRELALDAFEFTRRANLQPLRHVQVPKINKRVKLNCGCGVESECGQSVGLGTWTWNKT